MRTAHALVTGAAGGIGRELVDCLLATGWDVTVTDLTYGSLNNCAYIKEVNLVHGSMGDEASIDRILRKAFHRFDRLDAVFMCHSCFPFHDVRNARHLIAPSVAVELAGPMYLLAGALKLFEVDADRKKIIGYISSQDVRSLDPKYALYSSCKLAMEQYLTCLSQIPQTFETEYRILRPSSVATKQRLKGMKAHPTMLTPQSVARRVAVHSWSGIAEVTPLAPFRVLRPFSMTPRKSTSNAKSSTETS